MSTSPSIPIPERPRRHPGGALNPVTLLPAYLRKILDSCPITGGGVHYWIFKSACALAREGVDPTTAARLIRDGSLDCGREVLSKEITEAIGNAARVVGTPGRAVLAGEARPKVWPAQNLEQIEAIGVNGPGLEGLEALSPIKWTDDTRHTEEIVDALQVSGGLAWPSLKTAVHCPLANDRT